MGESLQTPRQQQKARFGRVSRVSLRVRDLARSIEFYESVLGCVSSEEDSTDDACHLRFALTDSLSGDVIELIAGRSISAMPGMGHFSIEVPDCSDVARVHAQAVEEGGRVLPLRTSGGMRKCMIFDPDGYLIEVYARQTVR